MTTSGTLIFNTNADEIDSVNLGIQEESSFESSQSIEDEDEYLNSDETDNLIGAHDFAIILRSGTNDINLVIPEIENFEELEEEEKKSISQNQFLVGFLNYALNNEDWLNEYAFSLKNKTEDFLSKFMNMMSEMQNSGEATEEMSAEFLKQFMNLSEQIQASDSGSVEEDDGSEKDIDFASAVEQLNKSKPKIIT
jgi:hypothetical protein